MQANDCEANASFNSTRSIFAMERLALFNAFLVAGTGPIPIMAGSTPATAIEKTFAKGFNPYFFTIISLANSIAAAPSLMPDELPAVTVPSLANAGFKEANFSKLVLRAGLELKEFFS